MLIGDLIISGRELMPDLPATLLPPPVISAITPSATNPFFGAGTYYLVATFTTLYGETLPSPEVSVVLGVTGSINVTISANFNIASPQITGVKVYIGQLTGKEVMLVNIPLSAVATGLVFNGIPYNISTIADAATPPTRSTAFLPDTNGRFVSVGTIYRWINEALNVASYICKGIPDVSGIQMTSGQGLYTMPGIWDKLENCWYDGYPVAFDGRGGAFYRNVLSGITFICILQTSADRQIIELQPQPSRSGGNTTLSAPIGISDTSIPLTSVAQIGLPLGMLQVGTEIVSYSTLTGGSATGCARGLGGTQQQAWGAGTVVKELNFRFGGLRLNQQVQYQPGQALTSLQVPPGWSPALVDYLIGRFREAEQNSQGKGESIKAFTSFLKDYVRGTKQIAGPRQLGAATPAGDGYPSASSGGRIIIP